MPQQIISPGQTEVLETSLSAIAYVDDSTFLATSYEEATRITELAMEFYKINAIQIHPAKTKLLVMNENESSQIKPLNLEKQQ